jgi:hypothetical protein
VSIYIQMGYGKGDKVDKAIQNKSISGVVLSPRDEKKDALEASVLNLKALYKDVDILFDPQLYYSTYADAVCKNLSSYTYFPGIINLSFFKFRNINQVITDCLNYQSQLKLDTLVSPNIIINNFSSRDAQIALSFADESVQVAKQLNKSIYISLLFNESALNETANLNTFLNELTTFDVKGFYITVIRNQSQYDQIFESSLQIKNLMGMLYSLREINEYDVVMGYTDVLGVLLMPFNITGIATGWHNSSKKFTVKQKILPSTGGRLPRERYTSVKLLNSIYLSEIDSIAEQFGTNSKEFNTILSGTSHDHLLKLSGVPSGNWNRSLSHLQHWEAINTLNTELNKFNDISKKLDLLEEKIDYAQKFYSYLRNYSIQFEQSTSNKHLQNWIEGVKEFRLEYNV